MTIEEENTKAAEKYIELYNKGTPDWVDETHAKDAQWVEVPSEVAGVGSKMNKVNIEPPWYVIRMPGGVGGEAS